MTLTDFEWRVVEPLLPNKPWCVDSAAIFGEAIKHWSPRSWWRLTTLLPARSRLPLKAWFKNLWDEKGACKALQVDAKDIAAAEAAIPGSTTKARNLRTFRVPETVLPSVRQS